MRTIATLRSQVLAVVHRGYVEADARSEQHEPAPSSSSRTKLSDWFEQSLVVDVCVRAPWERGAPNRVHTSDLKGLTCEMLCQQLTVIGSGSGLGLGLGLGLGALELMSCQIGVR